jgi:hypothetical protein
MGEATAALLQGNTLQCGIMLTRVRELWLRCSRQPEASPHRLQRNYGIALLSPAGLAKDVPSLLRKFQDGGLRDWRICAMHMRTRDSAGDDQQQGN